MERQLGISGKPEIEAYGIDRFNALCRESVLTYLEEWERLTERIGFWIDTDRAYRTMDTDYIESVWWSLSELWRRGLIHESDKVVPYCPRCGTALSSHEVALGYMDVEDPSVYVRFPLADEPGTSLLVWTTTPWTLPSNQAVAVNPDMRYAVVEHGGERLILAEGRVAEVLGEDARPSALLDASELVGRVYEPPFPFVPGAHLVVPAGFVTTEDGTGIVHIAPAFGEDDLAVAREHGLDAPNPVDAQGRFGPAVAPFEGHFVKDADQGLIDDLEGRGRLLRHEPFVHSYPHCWRCSTPLLYYAQPSWYIRTTAVRDRMLELNDGIGWHPERVRDGRFGQWLRGNVDWAISRSRYWGTPLPFWRCADCDEVAVVGSFAELRERAREPLEEGFDPHRPYVDDVTLACACGGAMRRVPEVLDVWYDSGAMPFAQVHHPFDTGGDLSGRFPADFICEALDQTRGWFYSLLAEGTLLHDETAFRNVVCLGLILDGEGQKMSKSRGNVIEPWTVLDRQGADAFRWYLLTAQSPWESFRFSLEAVDEAMRGFLLRLWNTFSFLVTYASLQRRLGARQRRGRAARGAPAARPLDPVAPRRAGRGRHRPDGGLRRHRRRPGDRGLRRRPQQLVRPRVAPALLGGRPGGRGRRRVRPPGRLRHPARGALDRQPAAGPVHPLRGRGALRHPGRGPRPRRARQRPPGGLAGAGRPARPRARGGDGGGARGGHAGPRRAQRGEAEGAPAAGRGRGGLPARGGRRGERPDRAWSPRS